MVYLFVHVGFHVELLRRLVVLQRDEVLTQLVVVLVQLAGAVVNDLADKNSCFFGVLHELISHNFEFLLYTLFLPRSFTTLP
jgi:hypothetical protein